jgi:hypothetical protein
MNLKGICCEGPVTGCFEYDNKLSNSVKGGKFLVKLSVLLASRQGFWFMELFIHGVNDCKHSSMQPLPYRPKRSIAYLMYVYNAVRTT